MPLPTRVLIADDDSALRNALRLTLQANGFVVTEARDAAEALDSIRGQFFDLALLDINMPGGGFSACRKVRRAAPHTGIVMVTVRDAESDKVEALEAGADDYVTKPFQVRELVARLRAVLRRMHSREAAPPAVLTAGDLQVDLERHTLHRSGQPVHLAPKEFDLLSFMMQNQGIPLTHARLLASVWGPEFGNEVEYLRSYVKTLRRKIESDPSKPEYIVTEHWIGYRFCNPEPSREAAPPDHW